MSYIWKKRKIYDTYKMSGNTFTTAISNASTELVKFEVTFKAFLITIGIH